MLSSTTASLTTTSVINIEINLHISGYVNIINFITIDVMAALLYWTALEFTCIPNTVTTECIIHRLHRLVHQYQTARPDSIIRYTKCYLYPTCIIWYNSSFCDMYYLVLSQFPVSRSFPEIFGPRIFPWESLLHGH